VVIDVYDVNSSLTTWHYSSSLEKALKQRIVINYSTAHMH